MRKLLLLLFFIFSFTNCSKEHLFDCLKSTGDEITVHRSASTFTKLNMRDDVDVILYSDTTPFITVNAGAHLIDGIITEIENNTLYIRNENKCNWTRSFSNKYIVTIGMRDPEKIESYGSGNIECADTIRTNEFFFDSWNSSGSYHLLFKNLKSHINNNIGRADFHASGFTDVAFAYISDVATLDFSNLKTNLFYLTSASTGDCKVNVDNELEVYLKYTGDVYYTGNLSHIVQSITGTGKLIRY